MGWEAYVAKYPDLKILIRHQNFEIWRKAHGIQRKFTLIVFNTCTQEYEEVMVTEEVYRTYCRTRWNIKDNDQSFFDHEIQISGMIGGQDGAYENFGSLLTPSTPPEHIVLEQMKKRGPVPSDFSVVCCGSSFGAGFVF